MAFHEFITCDFCNERGNVAASGTVAASKERAAELGWTIEEVHACPACTSDLNWWAAFWNGDVQLGKRGAA